MKRIILTAIIFICFIRVNAQVWAPVGAKWHYNAFDIFMNTWISDMESIDDTLISGKSCRLLHTNFVGACNYDFIYNNISQSPIIYADSDHVYFYISSSQEFSLLYDFTKVAGDTFYIKESSADSTGFAVDSTDVDTISGYSVRIQYVSSIYSNSAFYGMSGKITEFLGHSSYFIPVMYNSCDASYTNTILCYKDSSISYFDPLHTTSDCFTIGINEAEKKPSIKVFPNPFSDRIKIDSEKKTIHCIKAYDTFGRDVPVNFDFENYYLSIKDVGFYILEIEFDSNIKTRIGIVKISK